VCSSDLTGSSDVGKKILCYCARHIKKTIMELGGKSAGIVLSDADLPVAVNGSLCSIFLNQGQMCTAMSRILVAKELYDDFVKEFSAKAKSIKLGKGMDYEAQMGPLISANQRKAVSAYVEEAIKQGAKLLCGGKTPSDPGFKDGFFFEPTVLTEVPANSRKFREEVFGPVVCINRFSTDDEAVSLANSSDFGLAGVIWSKNADHGARLAARIDCGISWINTYGMFYNEVPFGGFKQSGFGKELGREGFLEYTRLKNIIVDKTEGEKPLVNYWYGF
jgi:acyl-CoA reductase-like NAD-dependent aldehyde dehydrogenase